MRFLDSIRLRAPACAWLLACGLGFAQVQPCEPCLDVAPRGAPDGAVTVGDVIVLQRLVVGIDLPSPEEERRGDVAPSEPDEQAAALGETPVPVFVLGDGALTVGDVVLALRVVTGATSLRLLPEPELAFATPPRSCLGGFLTLYGRGLIVGEDVPLVFVDGEPAVLTDLRRGEDHGEPFDRITVREASGRDPAAWIEAPVAVLVRTGRGETLLEDALDLAASCERAPEILRLDPWQAEGGETVRIAGLDLACVKEVDFVSLLTPGLVLPARIEAVHSDNALDVVAPTVPFREERFDVVVRNDCGEATSPAVFSFPERPVVTPDAVSLIPPEGSASGGFELSIQGVDLAFTDAVEIGSTRLEPGDFFLLQNGDLYIPQVPPSPVGPFFTVRMNVVVSNQGRQDTTPVVLTYLGEGLPECDTIAPDSGPQAGGTTVIITAALGADFDRVDSVTFGGVPAENMRRPSAGVLHVDTPAFPVAGSVEVTLHYRGSPIATCPQDFTFE